MAALAATWAVVSVAACRNEHTKSGLGAPTTATTTPTAHVAADGTGDPTTNPSTEASVVDRPAEFEIRQTSETRLRLSDRHYVSSVIEQVFGPIGKEVAERRIATADAQFGGPCDIYNAKDCLGSSSRDSQAAIIPGPIIARLALVRRTCDKLADDDRAVRYAVTAAKNGDLAADMSAKGVGDTEGPEDKDIVEILGMFMPGRTFPPGVMSAMKDLAGKMKEKKFPPLDQWRILFTTICASAVWEIQ